MPDELLARLPYSLAVVGAILAGVGTVVNGGNPGQTAVRVMIGASLMWIVGAVLGLMLAGTFSSTGQAGPLGPESQEREKP